MKNIFIKLAVLVLAFSLAACSTNTQQQNTGIGVVTGAVVGGVAGGLAGGSALAVGAGAVVGGLVGGLIGHSADSSDQAQMYTTLDKNPANQPTKWTNTKTGATYVMVPVSKHMAYRTYKNCRKFYTTAIINGKKQYVHGVACRRADGTWVAVGR
jgi:surface antigen